MTNPDLKSILEQMKKRERGNEEGKDCAIPPPPEKRPCLVDEEMSAVPSSSSSSAAGGGSSVPSSSLSSAAGGGSSVPSLVLGCAIAISVDEFVHEVGQTIRGQANSADALRAIYAKYEHAPTGRSWTAAELRRVREMLVEIGFDLDAPLELNPMLPDWARCKDGSPVREANCFVWRGAGSQLGIDMDRLFCELEAKEFDKVKWSRRAKPGTGGRQNKLARHNCCFTDLQEPVVAPDPGDVTPERVRHKHPKNSGIKFTNYAFDGELALFRGRIAKVLGPFGYKLRHQFAELNKYYDRSRGIGRHGDIERGHGDDPGSVNCLKVGFRVPLLFSWYRQTVPVGKAESLGKAFPVVEFAKKDTRTVACVATLGHGDFYMMSDKAIGKDWKRSSEWTLRHCAGARSYTGLSAGFYARLDQGSRFGSAYSLTFSDCVENDSETPELQFSTPHIRL